MKVVIASGGFDPIHSGHIQYLLEAKKLGDILVVALNSDEWLIKKKGKDSSIKKLDQIHSIDM